MKMLNEFKVRVNKEESKKLQEVLLDNGFSWNGHNKEIKYLDCNYIYSSNKRLFLLDDEHYFNKCQYKELTVELILSFYSEKEFTYPMWFKSKETGDIVMFTDLTTGEYVFINEKYNHHTNPILNQKIDNFIEHTNRNRWEQLKKPNEHLDNEVKEDNHNSHYKKQVIDTITRSKANMTLQEQKAICIFQIDRYTHREKGQNLSDIKKTRDYLDWLEEIEKELENDTNL